MPLPPANVLAVDDNEQNLTALSATLGDLDVNLVRARSGREALRRLLEGDYAVILLDVAMPDLDGFETAELIRARERSRNVPIIFITAYEGSSEQALRGYALGAVDFLFKPIMPDVLRSKVGVFVDLFRKTAEVERQGRLLREAQQREHQKELTDARQRWEADALRADVRRKDEFIAVLSHELRNPIAPILHGIDLLERQGRIEDPQSRRALETMSRQVTHLVRLVDDLLDVGRITAGRIELRKELVLAARIVEDAVHLAQPLVDAREHELTIAIPDEPIQINGDATRLTQVIANLLNNAARYTPKGGKVWLELQRAGTDAVVRVRDSGPGFTPDVRERAFELFARGHQAVGAAEGGLGIGLALARTLVELHGGSIAIGGEDEGGAEVVLRLPGVTVGVASREPASRPGPLAAPAQATPRHVVLVEDNQDIREALAELLENEGFAVSTAADGLARVELILACRPDCAVIDVGLPALDGYGVARRVRAECTGPAPWLVAVTGWAAADDKRRALEAGFDAHLAKPVRLEALLAVIRKDDRHVDATNAAR